MTTGLHEERLAAVIGAVRESGARTVLDLGCGDGDLVLRLLDMPGLTRITGIEIDAARLRQAQARLAETPEGRRAGATGLRLGSRKAHPKLAGYDCACLVEVIEHLPPADINRLERAVFAGMRPDHVIVTTPNAEYNPVLGVPAHRFRHPDHHFEWDRARFARWGQGVAARGGYTVAFRDICGAHPRLAGRARWRSSAAVTGDEIAQDALGRRHIRRAAHGDEVIGGLGGEIALVAVDADARLEPRGIGLGVELRGIDMAAIAHHLESGRWATRPDGCSPRAAPATPPCGRQRR